MTTRPLQQRSAQRDAARTVTPSGPPAAAQVHREATPHDRWPAPTGHPLLPSAPSPASDSGLEASPPSRGAPTQAQALGEIVTPAGEPRALPETQVRKNRNPSLSPGQTGHRTLSHLPSQTKRAHLTRLPFLSLPPELDEGQSSSNFTGLHCTAGRVAHTQAT